MVPALYLNVEVDEDIEARGSKFEEMNLIVVLSYFLGVLKNLLDSGDERLDLGGWRAVGQSQIGFDASKFASTEVVDGGVHDGSIGNGQQ